MAAGPGGIAALRISDAGKSTFNATEHCRDESRDVGTLVTLSGMIHRRGGC
jgi:hypothetical protein